MSDAPRDAAPRTGAGIDVDELRRHVEMTLNPPSDLNEMQLLGFQSGGARILAERVAALLPLADAARRYAEAKHADDALPFLSVRATPDEVRAAEARANELLRLAFNLRRAALAAFAPQTKVAAGDAGGDGA